MLHHLIYLIWMHLACGFNLGVPIFTQNERRGWNSSLRKCTWHLPSSPHDPPFTSSGTIFIIVVDLKVILLSRTLSFIHSFIHLVLSARRSLSITLLFPHSPLLPHLHTFTAYNESIVKYLTLFHSFNSRGATSHSTLISRQQPHCTAALRNNHCQSLPPHSFPP